MEAQSVLHPPNASNLTDDIIRSIDVAPRRCTLEDPPTPNEADGPSISTPPCIRRTGVRAPVRFAPLVTTSAPSTSPSNDISPLFTQADAFLGSRELFPTARDDSTGTTELRKAKSTHGNKAEARRIELRRQRDRQYQERYRRKGRLTLLELELRIQALHGHINQLQLQKEISTLYSSTCSTVWGVTAEYYRLFRFGRSDPVMTPDHHYIRLNPQVQEGFVRTAVAPDVHYGTVQGVEALLENWRYLSLGFKGIEIQLDRLESGTDGSVVATSTTMFTITENTLRVVFPHLLDDEENGKLHPIGAKLLGQQVHVKALTEFNWDGERGCMTSIHMTPDLFTPLLRILGSLEDVAHVFSNARMTSECKAIN